MNQSLLSVSLDRIDYLQSKLITGENLWRCSECGKWSHAKKMPKKHERFVEYSILTTTPPPNVIREEESYAGYDGQGSEGGWWVECGPFEAWIARKVEA